MTNHLCSTCLALTAFGWDEMSCDNCAAVDAAMRLLTSHDCATLIAFGWEAPDCAECEPVTASAPLAA